MAREGRVLSDLLRIDTKQHELLGFDFGDASPSRSAIIFGVIAGVAWVVPLGVFLVAVTGTILPSPAAFMMYLVPPSLATGYGWMEDDVTPRRRKITRWVLGWRWVAGGHRPLVVLGRHHRNRDSATVLNRIGARFGAGDKWVLLMPWRLARAQQVPLDAASVSRPDPVGIARTVQLYGTEQAISFMADYDAKHAPRPASRAAARKVRAHRASA